MAAAARMRRQGEGQCRHDIQTVGPRRVGGLARACILAGALFSGSAFLVAGPVVSAGATSSHVQTIHVSTAKVPHVGTVLTTGSGLTLYRFTQNPVGASMCTGVCAQIWPPYLASKGAHIVGPKGVKGLSLMNVGGGRWQVAFHRVALYRFEGDTKRGQAKGQGVENAWYAVLKSGVPAAPKPNAATPTTKGSPTTQPPTTTTQAPHAATTTPPTSQSPAPTTTPPTSPPTTTPPTSPPTTTPTTSPPTTTPTTTGGGGGVGF